MTFAEFERRHVVADATTVFVRVGGSGPPVLLLHGFPETHRAWAAVAPRLSTSFTVIAADLPGYGKTIGPTSDEHHERFSKRAIARTLVRTMTALGFERFAVVGHDRGARVAYRMALDHQDRITALSVLDVIPTLDVAERMTYAIARKMANWFWLAQPAPVPERTIGADPDSYVKYILDAWGGAHVIDPASVAQYVRSFEDPDRVHAVCEEYRADGIDLEHDRHDRRDGRRIACPVLALWADDGFVTDFGDPIAIWQAWANDVRGKTVHGGHFMMEESPTQIGELLRAFLLETIAAKATARR